MYSALQPLQLQSPLPPPVVELRLAVVVVEHAARVDLTGADEEPALVAAFWAAGDDLDVAGKRLHQRSDEDLTAAVDSVDRVCSRLKLLVLVGGDLVVVEEAAVVVELQQGVGSEAGRVVCLILQGVLEDLLNAGGTEAVGGVVVVRTGWSFHAYHAFRLGMTRRHGCKAELSKRNDTQEDNVACRSKSGVFNLWEGQGVSGAG